jgi:hypothetical protein
MRSKDWEKVNFTGRLVDKMKNRVKLKYYLWLGDEIILRGGLRNQGIA